MTAAQNKKIYTVSQLTNEIKSILETTYPAVWVEGEISNFTFHSSGHMYFSLKDQDAVLSCAMFKGANRDLKFRPEDGLHVICFGRVSLYPPQGRYQLYVENMEPKGVGALQLAFEQLKRKLASEGLFDTARKRPIPYLPQRIGIVTSPTGAAIRDILTVTHRRFQNVELILAPVSVQGRGAEFEIAQAIKDFNAYGKVDVLIVGRGGGSLEDLWAFNEEVVARAIFHSRIPVISAVGHEVDWTIADFVADFRAATPSAAAELVLPRKEDLKARIMELSGRLSSAIRDYIADISERLKALKESYILKQPINVIEQYQQRIDEIARQISRLAAHIVDLTRERFSKLAGKLDVLSPLAILSRGYSITFIHPEGAVVKDAASLGVGSNVRTKLHRGEFTSRVETIETPKRV